jgi:gallate decarboxylase subunit D
VKKAMAFHNPYGLTIRTIRAGRDYVWLVTGGVAHIGASAVAYWEGQEVRTDIISVPSHKEAALAGELAELACRRLGSTVTVVAGIHIDDASKDEILAIVEHVRLLAVQELAALEKQNP